MVGMEMADRKQGQIAQLRARLTTAKEGAAACVDQHPCLFAAPDQVAARCAVGIHKGSARAQDLDSDWTADAPLGHRRGRSPHEREHRSKRESHYCPHSDPPKRLLAFIMLRSGFSSGSACVWRTVEKIDDSRLQRVLRADHDEAVVLNQLLEHFRPMAQVIRRSADVGAHGLLHQSLRV